MELRRVVPVGRRLPDIGTAALGQPDREVGPVEGVRVVRQRRSEADLDPRSDLPVRGAALGDGGGSVALRLKFEPHATGDDGELAARRQHRASRDPEAVAERAARRQAQHLGGRQRPGDAEQAGDLIRVEAGAVVLDEVAAVDLADPRLAAPVSRPLSASSFRTSLISWSCATPAFCCSPSRVRKLVQSARSNLRFLRVALAW